LRHAIGHISKANPERHRILQEIIQTFEEIENEAKKDQHKKDPSQGLELFSQEVSGE
jgi:hypothetical protein